MDDFDKVILYGGLGVVLLLLVGLFGGILWSNAQRLDCYKINAHRSAAEATLICGPIPK